MALLYDLHERPEQHDPVLLLVLDGWIDAGGGGARALATVLGGIDTRVIGSFDTEALLDYRARRPVLHLVEGIASDLTWPTLELRAGTDLDGNDLLILSGAEPDHMWKAFCVQVADLADSLGVRLVLGLGAYPAPVPHTRPVRLSCTAATPALASAHPFMRYTVDVPAGAQAAIERACADSGLAAAGLWAQVPHYVATMPYPAAALALLEGTMTIAGLRLPTDDLADDALQNRERIDGMVASNPQHEAMVRALENHVDLGEEAGEAGAGAAPGLGDLPTGDELAAELERYLRDHGDGG